MMYEDNPTLGDVMIRIYAIGINTLLFVILTKIYICGYQTLIEPNKGFLLIEVLSTVFFMAWFSVNTYRWILKHRAHRTEAFIDLQEKSIRRRSR